ncbi:cysteine repeat modular protein 1 [Plasmodium sp. DRC-Itaito]|nr:cysteine repeat modular protein 1 [Plasmodium sp. DRC-Itaito]
MLKIFFFFFYMFLIIYGIATLNIKNENKDHMPNFFDKKYYVKNERGKILSSSNTNHTYNNNNNNNSIKYNKEFLKRLDKASIVKELYRNKNRVLNKVKYKNIRKRRKKANNDNVNLSRNFLFSYIEKTLYSPKSYFNISQLFSTLQNYIDQFCYPGLGRCIPYMNKCICYDKSKLKPNKAKSCLNNCGVISLCSGYPYGTGYKIIPDEFINNRKVISCVVSSLQNKLDTRCGYNKKFRYNEKKFYCIPYDLLDMNISGIYCVNNNKEFIFCKGFLRGYYTNLKEYEILDRAYHNFILKHPCDEYIYGDGNNYQGCQDTSISGRKCLYWNSLNIAKLSPSLYLHNYCRNPEGLSYIYCYVDNNGIITREYCEIKSNIIFNNIVYSREKYFDFDITMKNVSDFHIRLHHKSCNQRYFVNNDRINEFTYDKRNYTYHNINGEITLTISFKNFSYNIYYDHKLHICACFKYYYTNDLIICSTDNYNVNIGSFIITKAYTDKDTNVFYLNRQNNLSFNINYEIIKNEIYIIKGDYSYECNYLKILGNDNIHMIDNMNILFNYYANQNFQKIHPPLEPNKKYSYIYAYFDPILDLSSILKKNELFINPQSSNIIKGNQNIDSLNKDEKQNSNNILAKNKIMLQNTFSPNNNNNNNNFIHSPNTTFQKLNNLKNGSNLICIKDQINQITHYYYSGKIIYDNKNFEHTKYILKKGNKKTHENLLYIQDISNYQNTLFFSFTPTNCEYIDTLSTKEKNVNVFIQKYTSRLKGHSFIFPYDTYIKRNSRSVIKTNTIIINNNVITNTDMKNNNHDNISSNIKNNNLNNISSNINNNNNNNDNISSNMNEIYYFFLKSMSFKTDNKITYLCSRINNSTNRISLSFVHFSDLLFVRYDEFAHFFEIYSEPTNIYNHYLDNDSYNEFINKYCHTEEFSDNQNKKKIISVWSHENDNYISFWLISSNALTPFFLRKFHINSPRFTFLYFIKSEQNNNCHMLLKLYIFNIIYGYVRLYITNNFINIILVKTISLYKHDKVVFVENFYFNKEPYFLLLYKNNTIAILNNNLNEIELKNKDFNIYIMSIPLKVKCLTDKNITCFILYQYQKILWFQILFNLNEELNVVPKIGLLTKDKQDHHEKEIHGNNNNNNNNNNNYINYNNYNNYNNSHNNNYNKKENKLFVPNDISINIKYINTYIENDAEMNLENSTNITVINKLDEYIIYVSFKSSNKIHIYSTDSSNNTIKYYKYIKNENISNYKINYIFTYSFSNKNFINLLIIKEGEFPSLCVFIHEYSSKTSISYKYKDIYIYNKKVVLNPVIEGDKHQIKYFTLEYDKELNDQLILIDKTSGVLSFKFNSIKKLNVELVIVMYGLFHIYNYKINFKIVCDNGYYYNFNDCFPCPHGYYNNVKVIKTDMAYINKCMKCDKNKTTLIEKATNKTDCLCNLGYEYIKNPSNPQEFICSPCIKGMYKNTISNKLCDGNTCTGNFTTSVIAANNITESACFCKPGFYVTYDYTGLEFCKECLVNFYCPGNINGIQKCPIHNETLETEKRINFDSLHGCLCKKGYEPINILNINKIGSRDEHYYKLFHNTYADKYKNMDPKHICMECDIGYYKDTISFEPCIKCPNESTNKKYGSTSLNDCNTCHKGYYKNINKTCSICLPNHFCVGDLLQKDLDKYSGDAVICPNYSVTKKPYTENVTFKDCLCIEGYIKNYQESYNINDHCKLVPLNFYKDSISNDLGTPCPIDSITLNVGAKSINECLCNKGYFYNIKKQQCKECPVGFYCPKISSKNNIKKPIKCPKNSSSIKKGTYISSNCQCNFGYTNYIHINNNQSLLNNNIIKHDNKKRNKMFYSFLSNNNYIYKNKARYINKYYNNINLVQLPNIQKKNDIYKIKTYKNVLCIRCPPMTYKGTISNEPCEACPLNSRTIESANNSNIFFCLCKPGYYMHEQMCKPCSFNNLYCTGENIYIISEYLYEKALQEVKNIYRSEKNDMYKMILINITLYNYNQNVQNNNSNNIIVNPFVNKKTKHHNNIINPTYNFLNTNVVTVPFIKKKYANNKNISNISDLDFLYKESAQNFNKLNTIFKNFFHKDNENLIYVKYQNFVKCGEHTVIPLGVDSSYKFDDCKCKKGYYLKSKDINKSIKICEPCTRGTFKNYVGDDTFCLPCPPKSTSLEGSIYPTHCFCKRGFFYSKEYCLECLEGALCKGGLNKNVMKFMKFNMENILITDKNHIKPHSKKDYYLDKSIIDVIDVSEWKFIKCPIKGACLEKNKCHKSMNNYLCIECAKGYTNSFMTSLCVKCPNNITNIILLFLIYIIFCFIIIIISYLNITSGFYRRSIHSIVIKIGVNYISSMLFIKVLEDSNVSVPTSFIHFYNKIEKFLHIGENKKIVSVDCLLRYYFNLNYSNSFFYSSVLFFLIPIFLIITLTIILFIILKMYQFIKKKQIANKLDLLRIAEREKIHFLASSLKKSYSRQRIIMILRYINLDNYKTLDKIWIFFEDMIPVYVTFLFIIHAKTSLRMFQLFDCSYIKYTKYLGKYILRRASSVQCSFKEDYSKFFFLGLTGTIIWSLGIPLFSFYVLYINRHNLFNENVRIKYGFLHNGYLPNKWYWEIIVFSRKISVLFIMTVIIFPSDESNASQLLLITFVAIFSLCLHFIFQPFDKRNYFTLNKLENLSLYIWVSTIICTSILLSMNLNTLINFIILFSLFILNLLFFIKLLFCLFFECIDNIRRSKACYHLPLLGTYAKLLGDIMEKKRKQEPIIFYDKLSKQICIMLPVQSGKVTKNKKYKNNKINFNKYIKNITTPFTTLFKNLSNSYKYNNIKKNSHIPLQDNMNENKNDINNMCQNENTQSYVTCSSDLHKHNIIQQKKSHNDNNIYLLSEHITNETKNNVCFYLNNSHNIPLYGGINKEYRMFATEIFKELFDIFLKNITLTCVSDTFFEFLFKITINISNLIHIMDEKQKIFESFDQQHNFNNIIQWSLERKEKFNENKKYQQSDFISSKNYTSENDNNIYPNNNINEYSSYNYERMKNNEMNHNNYINEFFIGNEKEKKRNNQTNYISKEEKEKLLSFFSDDLLNRKVALSEFYFLLIELKLKYFRNLPSYFYMFKVYKKLEKNNRLKQLKKLNNKLNICQTINDDKRILSTHDNLKLNEIKKNIPLLYKEFKNLSKSVEKLKCEYLNLDKNYSRTYSSDDKKITDMNNVTLLSDDNAIQNFDIFNNE